MAPLSLRKLTWPELIYFPDSWIRPYSDLADQIYSDLADLDPKVLRVILLKLTDEGVSLTDLWQLRTNSKIPDWYLSPPRCLINLITAIRFGLELFPDGRFFLFNYPEIPRQLINSMVWNNVDLNQLDIDGLTLLQRLILARRINDVRTLLAFRVDPEQLSADGKTALDIAYDLGDYSTVRLLRIYGAEVKSEYLQTPTVLKYIEAVSQVKPTYFELIPEDSSYDQALMAYFQSSNSQLAYQVELDKASYQIDTTGRIMSFPYYFNLSIPNSGTCSPPSLETVVYPTTDEQVYLKALQGLPNIQIDDLVENLTTKIRLNNTVPTLYYPYSKDTVNLPTLP